MALFLIERSFAEQLDLTGEDVRVIEDINADEGVNWLFSFLSADRRRSYCLYEAPSPDQIITAAKRAKWDPSLLFRADPAATRWFRAALPRVR